MAPLAQVSALDRVLSRVGEGPGGCWIWPGSTSGDGYGQIRRNGRLTYTHRLTYVAVNGPVADGLQLDHLCRNRRCCNPGHLEAVTALVNTRRGRAPNILASLRNECLRGHVLDGSNTYRRPDGNRVCRACVQLRRAGLDA